MLTNEPYCKVLPFFFTRLLHFMNVLVLKSIGYFRKLHIILFMSPI